MSFCSRTIVRIFVFVLLILTLPTGYAAKKKSTSQTQSQTKSKKKSDPKAQPEPQLPPAETITYEQVDKYIKYFAGLGMHRAGSKIDRRAAHWIKTRFKRDKLEIQVEPYTFDRPVSRYAVVSMKIDRINSVILPGMPLLNAKPTNRPIKTKLGFVGQDGTVPVIHIYVTPQSGNAKLRAKSIKEFKDAVKSGRYKAVIGVTQGGYAGLVPLAVDLNKKYDTPAMLMSSEIGNFAEVYAEINNPVKFLTRMRYKKSKVENIIGIIKGTNPKLTPIVVITPRSAWWYAAAERGTGVAAFLSAAKALAKVPHLRTIYFVSTSGQEYYSLGVKKFMETHPQLSKDAFAWIYVGGNIGTKPVPHYILQGSSRSMRRMVHRALNRFGIEHLKWIDSSPVLLPPLKEAFDESDHAVIIAATNNRCARMTCDKWPSNVNVEATLKFSKALTALIEQLAAED